MVALDICRGEKVGRGAYSRPGCKKKAYRVNYFGSKLKKVSVKRREVKVWE